MKKVKFYCAIPFASVAVIMTCSVLGSTLNASAATARERDIVVQKAEGELGKIDGAKYGGFSTNWCVDFVNWCINQAGGTNYSNTRSTTQLLRDYERVGKYYAKKTSAWSYNGYHGPTTQANYIPKKGDIVLIENSGGDGDGPDHVALVVSVEGSGIGAKVHTIEGNSSGMVRRDYWQKDVWGYCSPDYDGDLLGDVNFDGVVNAQDSSIVLQHYSSVMGTGRGVLDDRIKIADVNKDGKANASDASKILAYYSQKMLNPNTTWADVL